MKQLLPLTILATGIIMLGACKEKKQTEDIIVAKYVPVQLEDPIAMPADHQSTTVNWQGKSYQVYIERQPVDSLQMVTDDSGQEYIDNSVRVSVKRSDGSTFFQKTFLKGSFQSYIDDVFRRNGVLAGIRYCQVKDKCLLFSVVVGLPDAIDDVFVPLDMTIDGDGGIAIKKNDDMGMLDYTDEQDE